MEPIMKRDKQMLYYHYINRIKFLKELHKQIFTLLRTHSVGIKDKYKKLIFQKTLLQNIQY